MLAFQGRFFAFSRRLFESLFYLDLILQCRPALSPDINICRALSQTGDGYFIAVPLAGYLFGAADMYIRNSFVCGQFYGNGFILFYTDC